MTDEKWEEIVGRIKDTFSVEEEYDEPLEDSPGTRRGIVFTSPNGKMKLEYINAPVVLGTHGVGSKRIGSTAAVTYDYSDTESRQTVTAFRWEGGEWVEVQADALLNAV